MSNYRTRRATSRSTDDVGVRQHSTFSVELQESFKLAPVNDIQFQEVRLYIEGVQVPFESVNVSTPYMQKPTATISVPPAAGLTEIARNYFPKVHIFFRDRAMERYLRTSNKKLGKDYEEEDFYKLLFSGVIHRSSYGKNNNAGGASSYVQFQCIHKDYVLDEVSIKFGGRGLEVFGNNNTQAESVSGQSSYFSSQHASLKALEGLQLYSKYKITPKGGVEDPGDLRSKYDIDTFIARYQQDAVTEKDIEDVDPSILGVGLSSPGEGTGDFNTPLKFLELRGIPSTLLIMWQILKMDAYRFDPSYTSAMRRLYIPLIDQGLQYFKRLKGHSVIEKGIATDRFSTEGSLIRKDDTAGGDEGPPDVEQVMIPPVFRTFLGKALSVDLSTKVIQTIQAGMSEKMSLEQLFMQVIQTLRYDKIYLSSPVQGWSREVPAIDKVVKPLLPFYYSPVCNVFLPNLYHSLTVNDSYYETPTRVVTVNRGYLVGQGEALGNLEYRAPHDVRKAWAYAAKQSTTAPGKDSSGRLTSNPDLQDSLPHRGEIVAAHELGQGIRSKVLSTPTWINHLNMSHDDSEKQEEADGTSTDNKASLSSDEQSGLDKIINAWNNKYKLDPVSFNPWEEKDTNGLFGYQRNIMNTLDYDYSLSLVETRTGQLSGPFNPYVIPGYPCDVLDPSPDRPSYHGFVVSVNHSISGSGNMSTSVSFSSAMSYDEMQSYDTPPVFPWIRVELGLDEKSNLLNQPEATKKKASNYYKDVLGVGFADPTYMYDFDKGLAKKVLLNTYSGDLADRSDGVSSGTDGDESPSPIFDTVEGNLILVRREIESMSDIEQIYPIVKNADGTTLSHNVKFIHIDGGREGDPSAAVAKEKSNLTEKQRENVEEFYNKASDAGKSTFLSYPEPAEEANLTSKVGVGTVLRPEGDGTVLRSPETEVAPFPFGDPFNF